MRTHNTELLAEIIVDLGMNFPETRLNVLLSTKGKVLENKVLTPEPEPIANLAG